MCVDVEPGTRTAAVAVAWEADAQISLLVLAFSLLDRERVLQQRVLQHHRGVAAARAAVAAAAAAAAGVTAARGGRGLHEAIRPSH